MQNLVCVGKTSGGTDLKCWQTCRNSRSSQVMCSKHEQNIFSEHTGQRTSLVRCTVTLASLCSPAIFPGFPLQLQPSCFYLTTVLPPTFHTNLIRVILTNTAREMCRARGSRKKKGLHLDFIAAQFSPLVCGTDRMGRAGPANTESAWMSTVDRYWYWSADWDCCWGSAATWCEARRERDANTPNTGRGD